jgi:ribosome-binding protein aMBF1 (putative translation factor)
VAPWVLAKAADRVVVDALGLALDAAKQLDSESAVVGHLVQRAERLERGMTQGTLAEHVGIHVSQLRRYEAGSSLNRSANLGGLIA